MMRIGRMCLLLPLCVLLWGCNEKDKKGLTEDAQKLATTAGTALKNAELAGKVNGVLTVWKGIDMSGFQVQTEGSTVTLEGSVRDEAEHRRVVRVVNQIRGVEKVVDKLTVKGGASSDEKPTSR